MAFEIDSMKLQAFFTLANTKNFSKAARSLGLTQSALSQRIARLEDQLEQTLFIRKPKDIRLTAYGEKFLRYCYLQKNLEEDFLQNDLQKNSDNLHGRIRIAGYSSVMRSLIISSLAELAHINPGLSFEFITEEIAELPNILLSGGCDLLIYPSFIEREGLEVTLLGEEENVEIIPTQKIKREDYLDHDLNDRTTLEYLRLQGKKNNSLTRSFMGDIYGIIEGVKYGYGRAVVSKHLVMGDKGIKILTAKKKMKNPIHLYHFQKSYLPQSHVQVIEVLQKKVKTLLRHGKNDSKSRF